MTRDEFVQHFAGNSSTLRIVALGLFLDMDSDKNGMLEQNDATTYFNKIDTDGRRRRLSPSLSPFLSPALSPSLCLSLPPSLQARGLNKIVCACL